jgi:hypothetical protein
MKKAKVTTPEVVAKVKKQTKLEQARVIIAFLEKEGVEVDERVPNKKWMIEEDEYFFGCSGSHYCDVDGIIEIGEMYMD